MASVRGTNIAETLLTASSRLLKWRSYGFYAPTCGRTMQKRILNLSLSVGTLQMISISPAQLARHQLSRSHNSVTFPRVDTQDYASDACDMVSLLTVVG